MTQASKTPNQPGENQEVAKFLAELDGVPLFENLGKPIQTDARVARIANWSEWPGPEDPSVSEMNYRQQALFDELVHGCVQSERKYEDLWRRVQERVLQLASKKVPYDPNQDSWYGPNAAAWHAAWTAGLIALCLCLGRSVPTELQNQWRWFLSGHWPCALVEGPSEGKLVVF